ncbi:hypothetical protein FACS1894160_4070 [Bacteroidia bacterium]|nr:hypothetical protein FACS1894123_00760 [Bacteroidia bacterium]GHV08943.1 hypothetical protein FACS1894160_4070 [Bacteroidia bacterium]
MKLKSILILVVFSLMSYSPMQAEGLFNKPNNSSNQKAANPKNGGRQLKDPPTGPGGGGPGSQDAYEPIPDGLLILTLLAGGYVVLKARKKERNL